MIEIFNYSLYLYIHEQIFSFYYPKCYALKLNLKLKLLFFFTFFFSILSFI